jgi:hypothetical protein
MHVQSSNLTFLSIKNINVNGLSFQGMKHKCFFFVILNFFEENSERGVIGAVARSILLIVNNKKSLTGEERP